MASRLKRFSGGGTVVLDYNSIWTTVIGRRDDLVDPHFPRPIMEYTANRIFGPTFERLAAKQTAKANTMSSSAKDKSLKLTMILDTKSCGIENNGRMVTLPRHNVQSTGKTTEDELVATPIFRLRENDYVLGERKMGGNAQSIGKTGWLHHTSFLWDYHAENMEYLTLPAKRPDYRGDRHHRDFLVKLTEVYPALTKADFFAALAETCEEEFRVERVTLSQAMQIVNAQGGMKVWLQTKSRTRVLTDL